MKVFYLFGRQVLCYGFICADCLYSLWLLHRPELNIHPWEEQFGEIKRGSQERSWKKKEPFAYWKGNPDVSSPIRTELLNCNDTKMWRAQIMRQVEFKTACWSLFNLNGGSDRPKARPDIIFSNINLRIGKRKQELVMSIPNYLSSVIISKYSF